MEDLPLSLGQFITLINKTDSRHLWNIPKAPLVHFHEVAGASTGILCCIIVRCSTLGQLCGSLSSRYLYLVQLGHVFVHGRLSVDFLALLIDVRFL